MTNPEQQPGDPETRHLHRDRDRFSQQLTFHQSAALQVRDYLYHYYIVGVSSIEATYPDALKTQRKVGNTPSRGLWVP